MFKQSMNLQIIALTTAPFTAIAALTYGAILTKKILAADPGSSKIRDIGSAIESGAIAYLKSQFKVLSVFLFALVLIIYFWLGIGEAATFPACYWHFS